MRYWYDCEFIEDGITLELISIGIVAEDGREYYAQSIWLDLKKASPWVLENVIPQLTEDENVWKNRETIKQDILAFMDMKKYGRPELWGYYSAYDHVVFCQLFGTMMDLPKGYPMYTRDLQQWCDQLPRYSRLGQLGNPQLLGIPQLPERGKGGHNALEDARWNKLAYEYLLNLERA